ncbi:MAG: hemin receptor [Prevotella sp.]|nr:hemin receptor [Prevotella sp.]
MKTKYSLMAAVVLLSAPLHAQETYQDTKVVENELNGTARYVGMGGAMEALGADLSTISSNPAGIGLFRSSQFAVSGGLVSQQGETTSPSGNGISASIKGNKTNASFDQVGFVYAVRNGRNSYLNFAFNYHKSRNFDQILTAVNTLSNASQNKLTSAKYPYASEYSWNGVDANYASLMAPIKDASGKQVGLDYLDGSAYVFGQYQKGYIGEYDFNLSGNIKNRVFLGLTFGLHDVNYRSNSYYTEDLEQGVTSEAWEDLRINGSGFDMKLGAIFRPIETSPFRIGLYVNTPTWYDLNVTGYSDITMTDAGGSVDKGQEATYDYKVYTPWKFGVSVGHTVGKQLALGATYEYADYGTIDNRVNDGGYYDYWSGGYYENSYSDNDMNDHTKATLKGVSTLKLGLEYKILDNWAVRLGYNYLSPMYNKDGYRDGSISSPGSAYATSTDYTNWQSTNRLTCGFGYSMKNFYFDMAYQYTQTNGEFYPFMSYYADNDNAAASNIADAVSVSNKRHQLLLTLGYRF